LSVSSSHGCVFLSIPRALCCFRYKPRIWLPFVGLLMERFKALPVLSDCPAAVRREMDAGPWRLSRIRLLHLDEPGLSACRVPTGTAPPSSSPGMIEAVSTITWCHR
jgi:hypothetical protein